MLGDMTRDLAVLHCGNCEGLKLGVHATAFALSFVMGAYNAAAWLIRREAHLAINAALYAALMAWEQQHVAHHLLEMRRPRPVLQPATDSPVESPPLAA
jgi:hypothetical protein